MYPELYTFSFGDTTVPMMTYGVGLIVTFILFYWMLWRLGRKYEINTSFFSVNLLAFFLTTTLVSRLFHVILYYGLPTKSAFTFEFPILSFFLMSDFYFSLGGAIVGFLIVLLILLRNKEPADRDDVLDIVAISWLFGSIVGYLGAFFGGQTYGIRSEWILSVDYINNPILAEFPRFPLAVVYAICIIFIFSLCYIVKKLRPERGLAVALAALLWGIMWFIGEWWNDASSDNIAYLFGFLTDWKVFNFNQILAFCMMCWGSWKLAHIIPSPLSDWIIEVGEKVQEILEPVFDFLHIHIRRAKKRWWKW